MSFGYEEDDEGGAYEFRNLELTFTTWEALGSPEELTVTIEPGDLLNA